MTTFEQIKELQQAKADAYQNRDYAWNVYNEAVDSGEGQKVIEALYIAAKDAEFKASEAWANLESAKCDYLISMGFLAHV